MCVYMYIYIYIYVSALTKYVRICFYKKKIIQPTIVYIIFNLKRKLVEK